MAKITKSTDKSGRTVYKIAGTKKFAFTLAKAKQIAAKAGGTGTAAAGRRVVRVKKSKPSAAQAKKDAAFEAKLVSYVINNVGFGDDRHPQGSGVRAYKKAHAAFKKDPYTAAGEYDISADHVTPSFVRTVLRELKSEIDDLEGLHKPARGGTRTASAKRVTKAYAAPVPKSRRRPAKGGKKVSRAKPTKILGRSVTAAMKIVRTKGRDLKESDANKKKTVARYRNALQRAGYLRGATTRRNAGTQYFKEVVCEGGSGGGGCGAPLTIFRITEEAFDAARGPKRSNDWFEHTDDEAPEVDGPFKVVLGYRLCRDCRE